MKLTPLSKIEKLHRQFKDLQKDLSSFGAFDSEPTYWYEHALDIALSNYEPFKPKTAREWQIYSSMTGSKHAADKLNQAAKKVVDAILAAPIGQGKEIRHWLNNGKKV